RALGLIDATPEAEARRNIVVTPFWAAGDATQAIVDTLTLALAAAVARLGGAAPALYHIDATQIGTPRARTLPEEIARVVRARAANPAWANGMMNHGFRGAAEVAATLDHLAAFAHLTRNVPAHLFDLYHEATLGRDDLVAFMTRENPAALAAMRDRFAALRDAGLWITRRNSIAATLEVGA
ncbi:MAG: cobaltochelatase subunit CobN, partial [Paracoccaceae bacterium]